MLVGIILMILGLSILLFILQRIWLKRIFRLFWLVKYEVEEEMRRKKNEI